jgi:hypothetical protein
MRRELAFCIGFAGAVVAALAAAPVAFAEDGADAEQRQRSHWAFQPLQSPAPPPATADAWSASSIDRFIFAKLAQNGLSPAAEAEERALLRRITFDLTGLPPTPEERAGFLADCSNDADAAFARVVDRLLASPAYGERFGRHWLDVVRYADTAGNPPDFPVPQARRYRDWVIDSLSSDKPFDQFVREQIAGDLLPAESDAQRQAQTIATGYLAIGRRYFGTTAGADHLEIEDLIQTLGVSLVGLSIGCARCHDHKFDPVSQHEYYALHGIFSSTRFPQPGAEGNAKQENFVSLPDGTDAYAVADGTPASARLQFGGEPGALGDEVPRGFPAILGGQSLAADASGSGRLELAQWLTDPKANPLLARVIVNRVWRQLFGEGLARTPNDFGLRGEPPTHPELLDHLASGLVRDGWSLKRLHRRIVLSRSYRMSSTNAGAGEAVDPSNRLLWRQSRRRLDAESLRDALLAVSGALDRSRGQEHPFPPQEQWGYSQHAPFVAVYESDRRSVYLMQQRLKRHPLLALFDGADPNASTGGRMATTTPLQSLFWLNDPLVHQQAVRLAERVLAEGADDASRLSLIFDLLYGRPPSDSESAAALAHLARFESNPRDAWSSLARVMLAANEFSYVD